MAIRGHAIDGSTPVSPPTICPGGSVSTERGIWNGSDSRDDDLLMLRIVLIFMPGQNLRRKREFQKLERKVLLRVIAATLFVTLVATLAVYFGINVHDH